jgi:hypothetical protein
MQQEGETSATSPHPHEDITNSVKQRSHWQLMPQCYYCHFAVTGKETPRQDANVI